MGEKMLTMYKVQYRLQGQTFKKAITKVIEDGMTDGSVSRYFIKEDGSRIEVPLTAEFYFDADRAIFIQQIHDSFAKANDDAEEAPIVSGNIPGIAHPANL
tara:strand:- start:597 stop:899 length:303 start_codon:yes stop_codon:yes gene_type:complete